METGRAPVSTGSSRRQNDLNTNQKTNSYGVSSTPLTSEKNNSDLVSPTPTGSPNASSIRERNIAYPSTTINKSANQLAATTSAGRLKKGRGTQRNGQYEANSVDGQRTNAVTNDRDAVTDKNIVRDKTPRQAERLPTEQSIAATGISANYELVASLPLSTKGPNWNALLNKRANRIRQAWTPSISPVVEQEAAVPASQPVQRLATRLRIGATGEVASSSWNTGGFAEVLLGRHLSLAVGFVQATYTNKFTNDDDFEDRTHRNFKKEFGPGIDQLRDILNIDTRQTRYQVPITIGYRIPLSQTLTLLPTVGTYLNLNNTENVTFYCRLPLPPFQQTQRAFGQVDINKSQPINLINSLSLGTGLEWHSRHWALQGSPILNIPMQAAPTMQSDLNWQQKTTVSLRARLLYQF
ncbi:hypothetical protein GO730_07200 [Spirosoma sp. HMF3257]|uniref:hypothetical protein n=1 Tax=Spirosoma telluris TaxID=2183553 RepID=UPI0011B93EEA|nr:hypothetical protein [Spirosoma telluris]